MSGAIAIVTIICLSAVLFTMAFMSIRQLMKGDDDGWPFVVLLLSLVLAVVIAGITITAMEQHAPRQDQARQAQTQEEEVTP